MAVGDTIIGRNPASAELDWMVATGGTLVACVYIQMPKAAFITGFRFQGGRAGESSPVARAALYLASQNGAPTQRLGYSEQVTISAPKNDAASGAFYTPAVAFSDDGPSNASIPVSSGQYIAVALLITGATANLGMMAAARIVGLDENFYRRFGLSQPPPAPFGTPQIDYEGNLTLAAIGDSNEAPVVPVNRTPAGLIASTTPDLAGDHRDRNGAWGPGNGGADVGDYMKQYQTQVRRQSDQVLMWSPAAFTASPAERAADRFQVPYGGTALVRGTVYEWRCRTSDHHGAWGPWSNWLEFTPAALGLVTLDGAPTGKIETDEPDFQIGWTHEDELATNAVQLRHYQGDTLIHTSGVVSKTIAHGATGTLTFGESGIGNLLWGTVYKYSVRGRDIDDNWSDWSPRREYRTNAPPGIPDGLSPGHGQLLTSYPKLTFLLADADDTVATGLIAKVRIKDDAGDVLAVREATFNPATGFWGYQTDGDDLETFDTYRWDAYGFDGTLYSGARLEEHNAVKSGEETFVFAEGPTVAITSPDDAEVIASSTPTVAWTASEQNRYRLRAYVPGTDTVVYQRGPLVSAATSWQIPAGYLRNHSDYDLEVWVEDDELLTGVSQRVAITTAFTPPPTPTGFSATPIPIRNDPAPTAIRLQADPSTEPAGDFVGRYIYRDDLPDHPLAILPSPDDTTFIDYEPVSGREYTYTWRDVAQRDLDQVESEAAEAAATVQIRGIVLSSTRDPERHRVAATGYADRSFSRKVDEAFYIPWGAGKPRSYRRQARWWEGSFTLRLVTDRAATFLERLEDARALDEQNDPVCYRDALGRKLYLTITELIENDIQARSVDLEVRGREEQHDEGVRP